MSDLLTLAAARCYLPGWLYDGAFAGVDLQTPNTTDAAVLVVDLAGFTALTERLSEQGHAGAEETIAHLNAWLAQVLAPVEERGGDVTIFAGDSFTALFTGRSADERLARAAAAGLEILALGRGRWSARLGIADGPVSLFGVGDRRVRQPVAMGRAMREAALAMHRAPVDELWTATAAPSLSLGEGEGGLAKVLAARIEADAGPPERAFAPLNEELTSRALATLKPFLAETVWHGLSQPRTNGEHRPATTLFVRYGELTAPEPPPVEVSAVFGEAVRTIARAGGYVHKVESSDKGLVLLAFFGVPSALEDAAARAVGAALDLTRVHPLAAALTSGRVFAGDLGGTDRREFTAIGEAINRAARILQSAAPHDVVCDLETAAAAPGVSFEPPKEMAARGYRAPISVQRATGDAKGNGWPAADPAPFVGRAEDLEALLASLDRSPPQPVLVVGEVGIGKSRLFREAARRLTREGSEVCVAQFGDPRPFGSFVQLATALGQPVPSGREAVLAAVRRGLTSREKPPALFLEDLQLADDDERTLLSALIGLAQSLGTPLALNSRPGAPPVEGLSELRLGPLAPNAALELLASLRPSLPAREAQSLAERASGNPLFLAALCAPGASESEGLPRTVEEAIRVRLDRLPPAERRLLELAAVWGEDFDAAALVALAASTAPDAVAASLEQLCAGRYLARTAAGTFRFQHDLERTVAYDTLPFAQRRELHRAAATLLARNPSSDAAKLFLHLDRSGDTERAAVQAARVAREAVHALAPSRAQRYARYVLDHSADAALRCRAEAALARSLIEVQEIPAAQALATEVEARAVALGLEAEALEAAVVIAMAGSYVADYASSDAAVERGLARAERLGSSAGAAECLLVSGWNAWGRGDYPAAEAQLARAVEQSDPASEVGKRAASARVSVLIQLGRYDEAERILPTVEQLDEQSAVPMLLDYANIAWRRADLPRITAVLDRAAALIEREERSRLHTDVMTRRAWQRDLEGVSEEASRLRRVAREAFLAASRRYEIVGVLIEEAVESLVAGRFDAARAWCREAHAMATDISAVDEAARAQVLGAIAAVLSGETVSEELRASAAAVAERTQRYLLVGEHLALTYLVAPDPSRRAEAFARTLELCAAHRDRGLERFVRAVAVHDATRRNDSGEAATLREALAAAIAAWGCPRWRVP